MRFVRFLIFTAVASFCEQCLVFDLVLQLVNA